MQYYKIRQDTLTNIANSIREQNGTSSLITPIDMPSLITSLDNLNFRIVSGTDESIRDSVSGIEVGTESNGIYNGEVVLWLVTDEQIGNYSFLMNEPSTENLEIGHIWFQTSIESQYAFNSLKGNTIPLYAGSPKRWNGTNWEEVVCEIYIRGAWAELIPDMPNSWQWFETYAGTSTTWTAPESRWYNFHIIGKGGNGGAGGSSAFQNRDGLYGNYWGGIGGSGASGSYVNYPVYLKKGKEVVITYNTTDTTVSFEKGTITAPAGGNGGNGGNGAYEGAGAGGAAGVATEPTTTITEGVTLIAGVNGIVGVTGNFDYPGGADTHAKAGVATANPPYPTGSKYMAGTVKPGGGAGAVGNNGDYVATGEGTILGNPGSSGGNAGTTYPEYNQYVTAAGLAGGTGSAGGVVIEIAANITT